MPVIGTDRLVALQHNPNEIRNVRACLLLISTKIAETFVDLYPRPCRKSHLLFSLFLSFMVPGPWQNFTCRFSHRYKWHHFLEARG